MTSTQSQRACLMYRSSQLRVASPSRRDSDRVNLIYHQGGKNTVFPPLHPLFGKILQSPELLLSFATSLTTGAEIPSSFCPGSQQLISIPSPDISRALF
ncbi:hypothetical protein BV898_08844 [Hypsibius exemplaris]|uniref:Uncharacterized protein n=1 Tax=Hypsibius exemplaris TaxID=2072580 RepID=A0A1W0WP46_HYPEX|nr:hypothetical protein BV898_08844 [Hypsibius exemplaris]